MPFHIGDVTGGNDSDAVVIVVGGELDHEHSPRMRAHIDAAIRAGRRHLVLDFSEVSVIDSTGIGVLVGAVAKLKEIDGGSLAVACVSANVKRIFQLTGLDSMIPLHSSRDEALSVLASVG